MEVDSQPPIDTKPKARKLRSEDHKVVRIHTDTDTALQADESEFVERKTRGKRVKRKAPRDAEASSSATLADGAVAMDTEASAPKKPHFAKLSDKQEMVSLCDLIKIS